MKQKLSALDTVKKAFVFIYQNKRTWFNLAFPLIVLMTALLVFIQYYIFNQIDFKEMLAAGQSQASVEVDPFNLIMGIGLVIIFYAMINFSFVVAWHRVYLDTRKDSTVLKQLLWDRDKTRYFFMSFKILLLSLVIGAIMFLGIIIFTIIFQILSRFMSDSIADGINTLLILIFSLWFIYIFFRVSLVFPATAIGRKLTIKESWKIAKPYNLYLFLATVISGVLVGLLYIITSEISSYVLYGYSGLIFPFTHTSEEIQENLLIMLERSTSLTFLLISTFISQFLYFLITAVSISTLSDIYAKIIDAHNITEADKGQL